jgi:hypothetical protein
VDSWNDARIDGIYERQMMSNIHEEFSVTVARGKQALARLNAATSSTGRVIDAIRSGKKPTGERDFLRDLYQANFVFDAPIASTTFAELVATGGISKLQDRDIRDALNRYAMFSRNYEGNLRLARETTLSPNSIYLGAVFWDTDTSTWDSPSAIVGYDWDSLQEAHGELQSWQATQGNLSTWYSLALEAAEDVVRAAKPAG